MELCTRTFTSFLLSNSFFSSNPLLLPANAKATVFKFNSLKLSSFSPHIHLFQPFHSPHTSFSSPFTVSAASSSSSVAVGTEQDRLPAELNVTETEQLNSTVWSFFFHSYVASFKVGWFLMPIFISFIISFIWILLRCSIQQAACESEFVICYIIYNG